MKITNDPIPAIEGTVADITVCGTGAFNSKLRTVTISQPCYRREISDDDMILINVEDLPKIIEALQEIQKTYAINKEP